MQKDEGALQAVVVRTGYKIYSVTEAMQYYFNRNIEQLTSIPLLTANPDLTL